MKVAIAQAVFSLDYERALPASAVEEARVYVLSRWSSIHGTTASQKNDLITEKSMAVAWACLSDSDIWGLIAYLFEAHPEWSDEQCQEIIQAWVSVRRESSWQKKLLKYWRRWSQHHRDLREGLEKLSDLTWAQRARFCEAWSVNRPVMSPFCGVAEILLEVSKDQTAKLTRQGDTTGTKRGAAKLNKSDVIVVASDATIEEFSEFASSRQLLWALEQSGLSWSLYQPWADDLELDPHRVKGMIFWSHRHRSNDYVFHAMNIEKKCRALEIPVINSVLNGWDIRHSTALSNFRQAGVPCPNFQKFSNAEDIELPYPLILRVDGVHYGKQMHLVFDEGEARAVVESTRHAFLFSGSSSVLPPPNLAIEFVDVSDVRGHYHKYRAYVIGDKVLLRHKMINTRWLVNFASPDFAAESIKANSVSIKDSEPDIDLLVRAGRAAGSDVTALDYSKTQDGNYVFWEANRLFKMNGDKGYDLLDSVSEAQVKRRAARDRKLGESLLLLLQERFVHSFV